MPRWTEHRLVTLFQKHLHAVGIRLKNTAVAGFSYGAGQSHQMPLTASLTRMRLTVTHSAGVGNRAGFHQKNYLRQMESEFLAKHDEQFVVVEAARRLS